MFSVFSLNKPALAQPCSHFLCFCVFVHFGSLLCLPWLLYANVTRSVHSVTGSLLAGQALYPSGPGQPPSIGRGAWLCFGSPLSLLSCSRCCLELLELCLWQLGTIGCPFHCFSALMWHVRSGFKTFFITWECMWRTQNISSHICHFWCWQSNKINAIFLFTSVFGSPSFSVLSCPGWPRSQTMLTMLLPPNVPAYCSDNSSKF